MPFEAFIPTKTRLSKNPVPMITILKQGNFGINCVAVDQFFADADYTELLFDRESRRIGFRPSKEPLPHSYAVRRSAKGNAVNISASKFLRHYGIEHTETKSYPCEWLEKEGIVAITVA